MRPTRAATASFITLALLLAGCGSGGGEASTTTTTVTAPTTTVLDPVADKAKVEKLVLTKADLPAGWTESAPEPLDPQNKALGDKLNACVGLPPQADVQVAEVYGNTFTHDNNGITSAANSLNSTDLVRRDFMGLKEAKNFPCISGVLDEMIKVEMGSDAATVTTTSSTAELPGIASGADQFALRVTTTLNGPGGSITIYSDMLGVASDRFETVAILTFINAPAPTDLDKQLLATLVAKAAGTAA